MDGDVGARAARLRPGVLGWGHAVVGLLAAMVCVLLPSLVLMGTGGAQLAAGADGGDLDAVPKLDVPPWMALAQFVPRLIIVALVLRGARRKAGRESGNGAARRPGEMAAVESGPFFWSTDHGTVLHAVALVAAPFAALAVMTALSRFVGLARL